MDQTHGDGIKDVYQTTKRVVSKLLFGDHSLPQNVIKFLKENGELTLVRGNLNRKPISSKINLALNVVSLNQFQRNLDNTPFDELFHLSLDAELSNGKIVKIEKLERVSLTYISKFDDIPGDNSAIPLPNITLNEFINNGYREMGNKFFSYSGFNNNCQSFLLGLLRGSNALTPSAQLFIKQDTEKLFENIPWTRRIMDTITGIAAKADIIAQGGAIPPHVVTYRDFVKYYYQEYAIPNGITYHNMIRSPHFKTSYMNFKNINHSKQVAKSLRDIYPRGKTKHDNGSKIYAYEKYYVSKHIDNLNNTNEFADDVNKNLVKALRKSKIST